MERQQQLKTQMNAAEQMKWMYCQRRDCNTRIASGSRRNATRGGCRQCGRCLRIHGRWC